MKKRLSRIILYMLMLLFVLGTINQEAGAAGPPAADAVKTTLFTDVTPTDPNLIFINYIAHRGIIKGYPDGTFQPRSGLTRAEAATILVKASALPTPTITQPAFKDVPITHWAASQIGAAAQAGYILGFPDGTYQPEARLTRAQAISLIMRLSTQKERAALPAIKDLDSQHWAARDLATALALEMIGLSTDAQNIHPDAEITRGSLARALAVLLTKDPGLNKVSLEGKVSALQGQASLLRNGQSQEINNQTTIKVGDIIKTGANASLRINYPDGSSNLVEADSEITIKQSDGRRYIKEDGSPGIAVEYLHMSMDKGTVFGALATKHQEEKGDATLRPAGSKSSQAHNRLAALPGFKYLAAADNTPAPWYKTAEQKKVKVKVDMPWGVAAIRGTFLKITVNPDGTCRVSCLTGNAEVTGTGNNNGTVPLTGGTSSAINTQGQGAENATGLTAQDKAAFGQVESWLLETAFAQGQNREADIKAPVMELLVNVTTPPANQEQPNNQPTTLQVVLDALAASGIELRAEVVQQLQQNIQQAVQQSQQNQPSQPGQPSPPPPATSPATPSTGSGSGSSESSTVTAVSYSTPGTYGQANTVTNFSNIIVNAPDITLQNMNVSGSVTVNCPNAVLKNLTINGNLKLAAGIGEGNVTLQNVTVKGSTLINGGGPNSIEVLDCSLYTVIVDKENNSVRIVAKGTTSIGALTLNSGASLAEENLTGAGFSTVAINMASFPANARIILSGNFESVSINTPNLNLEVQEGSIGQLSLGSSAAGSNINLGVGVNVASLVADAAANISGSGQIQMAQINAAGVALAQMPAQWALGANAGSVLIGGQPVTSSEATLQSIAISQPAGKLVYTVGEPLDISGLTVTGTYSDNSTKTETITTNNISGFDSSGSAASQTITITVAGKTASYEIRIDAPGLPAICLPNPGGMSIIPGSSQGVYLNLDPSDATLQASSSDEAIAAVIVEGSRLLLTAGAKGTATIQLTAEKSGYQTAATSFVVTVEDPTELRVFSNWNDSGCVTNPNGPPQPATFTLAQPLALTFMNTYHHEDNEAPGEFSLRHQDGTIYGPWVASGGNDTWICYVNFKGGDDEGYQDTLASIEPSSQYPLLKPGTYTMLDSHGATWSHNGQSGMAGFLQVKGYYRPVGVDDDISSSFTDANFKLAVWHWLGNNDDDIGAFSAQDLAEASSTNGNGLVMVEQGISSLAGLEHFADSGLRSLNCCGNDITAIPTLPESLTTLTCYNNKITSLPAHLPAGLTSLNCSGNLLTSLPPLPPGLSTLDCCCNYLDIWSEPLLTMLSQNIDEKIITPQYRYTYAGLPLVLPPGSTVPINWQEVQWASSEDGTDWEADGCGEAGDFTFRSSDESVATVDPAGQITAVDNGSCIISAWYLGIDRLFTRVAIPVAVALPPGVTNIVRYHNEPAVTAHATITITDGGSTAGELTISITDTKYSINQQFPVEIDQAGADPPVSYAVAAAISAALGDELSNKYNVTADENKVEITDYCGPGYSGLTVSFDPGDTDVAATVGGFPGQDAGQLSQLTVRNGLLTMGTSLGLRMMDGFIEDDQMPGVAVAVAVVPGDTTATLAAKIASAFAGRFSELTITGYDVYSLSDQVRFFRPNADDARPFRVEVNGSPLPSSCTSLQGSFYDGQNSIYKYRIFSGSTVEQALSNLLARDGSQPTAIIKTSGDVVRTGDETVATDDKLYVTAEDGITQQTYTIFLATMP